MLRRSPTRREAHTVNGIRVSPEQLQQIRAVNAFMASGRRGNASALGALARRYNPRPANRTNLIAPARPGNQHLLRFSGSQNKWQAVRPDVAQAYLRQFRQTTNHGLFPHTPRTGNQAMGVIRHMRNTHRNYAGPGGRAGVFNHTPLPGLNARHSAHVNAYALRKAESFKRFMQRTPSIGNHGARR